jgi:hypothetical protein
MGLCERPESWFYKWLSVTVLARVYQSEHREGTSEGLKGAVVALRTLW